MINDLLSKPKRIYSPLRYPGGKARLATFLGDVITLNKIVNCTFVEPFAGGAGAALTLLFLEKVDSIIINDFDKAIYSFWDSILLDTDSFIEKLETVDLTIHEWERQKEIYNSVDSTKLELGFASFYLNRTNRSGIIEGGPIGGRNQSGKWKIDARFNRINLIERIKKISYYRNRIKIVNLDGIKLLEEYYTKENFLFYLDPPYFVKGSSLYLNHYKYEDHYLLKSFLNSNPCFNWLLTYDNTPEIAEFYNSRQSYEFSLNYHAHSAKKGREILIISDSISIPKPSST